MRVHVLRHAAFEGLGSMASWLERAGAVVTETRCYDQPGLPRARDFDWLIVMGGPMSVNDEASFPWLGPEKKLIAEAIDAGTVVLGVCLGAQLVACALGARVYPAVRKEIGWFPVYAVPKTRTASGAAPQPLASVVPDGTTVFHWHGDTFDLPRGSVHLLRSDACDNQAFSVGNHVLGLQFHLEMIPEGAVTLIEHCGGEIKVGATVQPGAQILGEPDRFTRINAMMDRLLDSLLRDTGKRKG